MKAMMSRRTFLKTTAAAAAVLPASALLTGCKKEPSPTEVSIGDHFIVDIDAPITHGWLKGDEVGAIKIVLTARHTEDALFSGAAWYAYLNIGDTTVLSDKNMFTLISKKGTDITLTASVSDKVLYDDFESGNLPLTLRFNLGSGQVIYQYDIAAESWSIKEVRP